MDGLAERLHAVAIHLLRHVRAADVTAGMTAARLSALSVLVFGGERTVTELAEAEQVATPTMTRLLQALEAEGLVRRTRDRVDRRVVRVRATARGRAALYRARAARVARLDALLAHVGPQDQAAVAAAVEVLSDALAKSRVAGGGSGAGGAG